MASLGKCDYCLGLGLIGAACRQGCLSPSMGEFVAIKAEDLGTFENDTIGKCPECGGFGSLGSYCGNCEDSGMIHDSLNEEEEKKYHQKLITPSCRHTEECRKMCVTYSKFLSQEVIMARSYLSVVRAYESMVQSGLKIQVTCKDHFLGKPKELLSVVSHHPKFCLCSLCKYCIVAEIDDVKQAEKPG
jgi:hypothetical protein